MVHERFISPSSQPCSCLHRLQISLYPLYKISSYTWKEKLLRLPRQNLSFMFPCMAIEVWIHLWRLFLFDQDSPIIYSDMYNLYCCPCWWLLFPLLVAQLCCAVLSGSTITSFSEALLVLTSSHQNLRTVYSLLFNFPFRSRDTFISSSFLVLLQILVTTDSNWWDLPWGGTVAWWLIYVLLCQRLVLGSQTREMFGLGGLNNILYHMLGWKFIPMLC